MQGFVVLFYTCSSIKNITQTPTAGAGYACPPFARRERCFDFAQHDKMQKRVSARYVLFIPRLLGWQTPPQKLRAIKCGDVVFRTPTPFGYFLFKKRQSFNHAEKYCPSFAKRDEQRSCGESLSFWRHRRGGVCPPPNRGQEKTVLWEEGQLSVAL